MGTLRYDGTVVEFDDRLLAHLQVVITRKLSRGESFLMSWRDSNGGGDGRTTVWIHPAQSLTIHYADGAVPEINPDWLDRLLRSANSTGGLLIVPEG
jgi:hypothetical protein